LHAALAPQASEWVAVLAVDMPGIGPEWFRRLQTQCGPGVGAMVRHAEACEPLAAIYPREALSEVTRRLGRGEGSLQALAAALLGMGQLVWVTAEPADLAAARSINTRADHSYWKTTDPETLTRFVTP
jgi:molybdopterin-guanine dinucleotide biosynthesis protein A